MKKLIVFIAFVSHIVCSQNTVTEEVILNNGNVELSGTLSLPHMAKSVPLAIFIHGSGNVDRNGNQGELAKANYIQILADSLNAKGIAFYRYDKRTANPKNFEYLKKIKFEDLVEDAKIVMDYFENDQRFNGVHIIGHSQGSIIGMLIAANRGKTYTSLAGPGTTIGTSLISQVTKQNTDLGKATQLHIQELIETDTIQEVNPFLISIFAPQNQSFLREWLVLEPSEEIKKLTIPTLILNGNADSQISEEDANMLSKAKPDAKLVIIEKMNHVLKIVENYAENQKSYIDPNFPISNQLIEVIAEFITSNE